MSPTGTPPLYVRITYSKTLVFDDDVRIRLEHAKAGGTDYMYNNVAKRITNCNNNLAITQTTPLPDPL